MKHLLLTFFILIQCFGSFSQADSLLSALKVDEILNSPSILKKDTAVVLALEKQVEFLKYADLDKASLYAKKMYQLSKKLDYKSGIALGLRLQGDLKMQIDDLDSAKYFVDYALQYSIENKLEFQIMKSYYSRANWSFYKSNYTEALEYYYKSDKIAKQSFPKQTGGTANGIGLVFRVMNNLEKSKQYFEEAYRLGKLYQDTSDVLQALNNLGIIAKNENRLEESLAYYEEGLELAKISGNIRREGEIYYNLSVLYFKMEDDETALEFMEKSAKVTELIGNDRGKALDYYQLGTYYMDLFKTKKAEQIMLQSLEYCLKTDYLELEIEIYNSLAVIYNRFKNYEKAFFYRNRAFIYKDSLLKKSSITEAIALENQINQERMAVEDSLQKEKDQLETDYIKRVADEKLKSRDTLLWASSAVIVFGVFILFFVLRSRLQLKAKNKVILERNNQILHQKEEIEEQHKEITDSINYAKRIQNALLSSNEDWDKISKDHFIYFQPKDVVSGDFYWAHHNEQENVSIWVTADCTGHGVPGAFMSMLGIGFLNEIVIENKIIDGPKILDLLRSKIVKALEQKGSLYQQKDGMDLALCIWNRETNMLSYTGANNSLYILRDSKTTDFTQFENAETIAPFDWTLIELSPNKMPVGFHSVQDQAFVSKEFQLQPNDRIISYTDGYADQFGGKQGKKLKYKPFKLYLAEIQSKPFKLQGEILADKFETWLGDYEQIDDVCVIGVRI